MMTTNEELPDEVTSASAQEQPERGCEALQEDIEAEQVKMASVASGLSDAKDEDDGDEGSYRVKWISMNRDKVGGSSSTERLGIVTQNENGPCPLVSIINVLILRGKLSLPSACDLVSADFLLQYLADVIAKSEPGDLAADNRVNYEQNVRDALELLPKLQTGLDVNVRFNGVAQFEYTPDSIIFDLLDISVYHGWLMDPQQEDVCSAINCASYNQLVDMIIANRSSCDSELVSRSMIAQQFLEESASQLTYHGLCELNASMSHGQLAVFFRNNHFSTIYKHHNELFLLVTDQGFLNEPRVVWETLSCIDGDNQFVDQHFTTVSPTPHSEQQMSKEEQEENDLQLALSLAQQEERQQQQWGDLQTELGDTTGLTDEQLAQRVQAVEQALAQSEQRATSPQAGRSAGLRQDPSPSRPSSNGNSRRKNCVIL